MIFPGRFVNLVSVEHASVLACEPLLPSQPCIPVSTAGEANSKTLILMFLAPFSNKPFICKLKYFLDKSTASKVWIHPSEMVHLVHNAFYKLALFQAHKLFFDSIYWSYCFCRLVGVFYLDFNRHDIQIDKTRRLFPDRTISSPPSNAWQFASQRNQSTVITNAITDVIKRSTWIRSMNCWGIHKLYAPFVIVVCFVDHCNVTLYIYLPYPRTVENKPGIILNAIYIHCMYHASVLHTQTYQ